MENIEKVVRARLNGVKVVGTLVEVNTEIKSFDGEKNVLVGYCVVKVGEDNLIKVSVMTNETTKTGAVSKLFLAHNKLDSYMNQRVELDCELSEGIMVKDESPITFNQINLKFVKNANIGSADAATFNFSGFVVKPMSELTDGDGNTTGYRVEIAQENYHGDNISVVKFDIDKADTSIANAIENYYIPGETVEINGVIDFKVVEVTKTTEVAFGTAAVDTFQRTEKTFAIKGGSEPFGGDEPTKYTTEDINRLIAAYRVKIAEKIEKEKAKAVGGGGSAPVAGASALNAMTSKTPTAAPKPNRAASLI